MSGPEAAQPAPGARGGPASRSALVVGCGLIGASVGMALRHAGWTVRLADIDPTTAATAAALGAGDPVAWRLGTPAAAGAAAEQAAFEPVFEPVDIAVVAVPPRHVAEVIGAIQRLGLSRSTMHVASIQSQPLAEIQARSLDQSTIVGTHPMAGRERGGPTAGSPTLFRDRPWIVCPAGASPESVASAQAVIETCGGRRLDMRPVEHDRAVALVSHLPQLASSAVAALLAEATPQALAVAGSGLRDVTRLADTDPALWAQIAAGNAARLAPLLAALRDRLGELLDGLAGPDPESAAAAVTSLIEAGRAGRRRLGGKHGGTQRLWAGVQLVIPDQPGALVDVLTTCRSLGVNVEDLRVDHTPGRPNGLLELLVEPAAARGLAEALRTDWDVIAVVQPHE